MSEPAPLLHLSGIDKGFPGVQALSGVGLRLFGGEIHALMGQNGAGKSTLIKVLTGLYAPDAGQIHLAGQPIAPRSTADAQDLGISTVYQEVNLVPNLSVAENLFIGRYPRRWGQIDWRRMRERSRQLLAELELDIDVDTPLARYSLSIQQMVAIARALNISARVLILDEPTSSLDEAAVQHLFRVMRRLREQGLAILFVTHFLDQVYAVSDRITVMRNGRTEGEYPAAGLGRLELVHKMVGPHAAAAPPLDACTRSDEIALAAHGLARKGALQPLDLEIHRGEVLGLCGLLGSGRTEAARLLFGADSADAGEIEIDGRRQRFASPRQAIASGLAFCSEDRKLEGAVLALSVRENIVLALQARQGWWRAIPLKRQQAVAEDYVKRLGIKTSDIETPIGLLSGGNQQKALLARWLLTQPRLLILDEPTRGIDVRAKEEIMDEVRRLCARGDEADRRMAVLFISSELPEVLRCSDRIVVLRDRQAIGSYARGELDERSVLEVIAGEGNP
ncbi:sugar ABC transporter ATP-binding protein [Mitsuaria sp. GD03876]|uniref:sugar ABC transporter ATP-binding protein n=1 Tax=Mitsuaria sp. GD03876 TaxID=2975399 RepID=UPI00244B99D0|nr:sugar ABC transporter ATP-binding protein [Mitsuaria sp. GD03876]MDH0865817.1 sugar ABC transporter ATP-binding protein [Mitsuaria sp. GD03876]